MIRLVCATQCREADFFTTTLLGRSLNFFRQYAKRFELRLFPENSEGLPAVYNRAIEEAQSQPRILVFVHDDIHFLDLFWPDTIAAGLQQFDLIGTLGCKRHYPTQLSWVHVLEGEKVVNPKREDVSGVVAHFGRGEIGDTKRFAPAGPDHIAPFSANLYMSHFGPSGVPVVLLDGMLLACRSELLHEKNLRFDERFDFHFYDMDICRQFEKHGLRLGTWPVSVLHGSHGSYNESFLQAYPKYVAKWSQDIAKVQASAENATKNLHDEERLLINGLERANNILEREIGPLLSEARSIDDEKVLGSTVELSVKIEMMARMLQGRSWGAETVEIEGNLIAGIFEKAGYSPKLAVDVGGNIGEYSKNLLFKYPGIELHIFEPSIASADVLRKRFSSIENIHILAYALSDEERVATLFTPGTTSGSPLSSLVKRDLTHYGVNQCATESVRTIRFDSYWREKMSSALIDVLKIDVEGFEYHVLTGMGEALSNTRVIQFEFSSGCIETKIFFRDFWYLLTGNGFVIYRVSPVGLVPIRKYSFEIEDFTLANYIAVNLRLFAKGF